MLRRLWRWLRGRTPTAPERSPIQDALGGDGEESGEDSEESILSWCLSRTRSEDADERRSGIAAAAAYGIAAIEPVSRLAGDASYVPTAIAILKRIASRGDKAAVLEALFGLYGVADEAARQQIIDTVASLQESAPSSGPSPSPPMWVRTHERATRMGNNRTPSFDPGPAPGPTEVRGHDIAVAEASSARGASPSAVPPIEAIRQLLLASQAPLRARLIARELASFGYPGIDRRTVNRLLYANLSTFRQDANWAWSVAGSPRQVPQPDFSAQDFVREVDLPVAPRPVPVDAVADDRLYGWQADALVRWHASGQRGIVQAITGAGKTRIGLAAIERHLEDPDARAAVVVPTVVLLQQWRSEIAAWLGVAPSDVGQCGGGANDDLTDARVTIYVVNSAADYLQDDVLRAPGPVLLVADECHRYGAPTFADAIEADFAATLGLSATPQRAFDLGMEETVIPALGPIILRYDYQEALRDGVISEFDVAFVGLGFTEDEAAEYESLDAEVARLKRAIDARFPELRGTMSQGQYFATLQRLASRDEEGAARAYLDRLAARKNWVIQASARERFIEWFVKDARQGARTFIFHESIAGADWIAEALTDAGVPAASHHSGKSVAERAAVLDAFRRGALQAITAARTLDEGVDVPDANVAVIAAGSSVTRQQVQRAGRVLRKVGAKRAKIVRLYVSGSQEDPDQRKDGSEFENTMRSLGRSARYAWPEEASELVLWLGEGRGATIAPRPSPSPSPKVEVRGHAATEISELAGRRAAFWGGRSDWPTVESILAANDIVWTGPQWALENPSALMQIRDAFKAGEFDVLAMSRISTWPLTGSRAMTAMDEFSDLGLPVLFAYDQLLSTSRDGQKQLSIDLPHQFTRPIETPQSRIDPEIWEQEAGWRDFRRNGPLRR